MPVETSAFLAMLRRMIRAAGRRVADGDEPELAELIELRAALDEAIADGVAGIYARRQSWTVIARATGTTRQNARQRWGKRIAS